jgi:hypothetical protein
METRFGAFLFASDYELANVHSWPRVCENYFAQPMTSKNTHESSIVGHNCAENGKPEHSHARSDFAPGVFTRPLPIADGLEAVTTTRISYDLGVHSEVRNP